jgi:hypothetical protein
VIARPRLQSGGDRRKYRAAASRHRWRAATGPGHFRFLGREVVTVPGGRLGISARAKPVDDGCMDDQVTRGPLAVLLDDAAAGRFPPADGRVTVLPPPSARDAGVIGFTAHAVIFIDADPAWVAAQLPTDDLSGPLAPAFLHALCAHTNRQAHSTDLLCAAWPLPGPPGIALTPSPTSLIRASRERCATAMMCGPGAPRAAWC